MPLPHAVRWLLALALLLVPTAGAQSADTEALRALVTAVEGHPALGAARASLEANRRRLAGVRDPITLSANYAYTGLFYEEPDPMLPPIDLPDGQQQISVSATLRPFLFGDTLDLADQRQIDVLRSVLGVREAQAGLEAQAVQSAASLLLAEAGVEVALAGQRLAAAALSATETRVDRGAATAAELERARLSLAQADSQLVRAEADLALATASLELLVGPLRLDGIPDLEPIPGVPPSVERSGLDLALAELAVRNGERGLIPTVQASYALNLDDDNTLSFSLESRTFQPTVSYQNSTSFGVDPPPSVAPALQSSFTIGVGVTVGPELFRTLDATRDQRSAAEEALRAEVERAPLTELSLQNGLDAAERQLALAEVERNLDAADLDDVRARVDLGLATDLEADRAALTLAQSELALLSARLERLVRTLDWYTSYAIPISEVLP
jgi:outer membrane protein TolC